VSTVAFEGFPCYWFEPVRDAPARGFLRADVSVECNTPEQDSVLMVSWMAILIYPIGMWLFSLLLLWKASAAITSGKPTPFSCSISFLYREYEVICPLRVALRELHCAICARHRTCPIKYHVRAPHDSVVRAR
jgi:hypothetical protein